MPRASLSSLARAAGALAIAGCGAAAHAAHDPPEPALRAYAAALAAGDAATLHALEAGSAHRGRDADAQRAAIARAPTELAELGRTLASAPPTAFRAHARAPVEGGGLVVLTRDPDGQWRIEGGALIAAGAGAPALVEPRDSVAALHSALSRRDLRGIQELLARRTRAAWEAEVARVLEETEDLDALDVRIDGERAAVTTPGGVVIELAREGEEWRVVDVRTSPASTPPMRR